MPDHGGFLYGDKVGGALKIPNSNGPNAKKLQSPMTNEISVPGFLCDLEVWRLGFNSPPGTC
jgi:hypothetical protein